MKGLRMTEEELQEFLRRGQRASEAVARAASRPKPSPAPKQSKLEARFSQQLDRVEGLPRYVRNYYPIFGREWEIDFCWADKKFGVEVDGGAHQAAARARRDYEKHLLLILEGWTVLRLDGQLVRSGRGIELVLEIMRARGLR